MSMGYVSICFTQRYLWAMDIQQPLGPTTAECLNRARADLRMGLPVVLSGAALAVAVETLSPARLAAMAAMGPLTLALTARRAETLKARAYDGDLARVDVPAGADLRWLRALADPADDLRTPMKGPLTSAREGKADTHRAALLLRHQHQPRPAAAGADGGAGRGRGAHHTPALVGRVVSS